MTFFFPSFTYHSKILLTKVKGLKLGSFKTNQNQIDVKTVEITSFKLDYLKTRFWLTGIFWGRR